MVTKSGTTDRKFFFPMTGETLQVGSTMLDEVAPRRGGPIFIFSIVTTSATWC